MKLITMVVCAALTAATGAMAGEWPPAPIIRDHPPVTAALAGGMLLCEMRLDGVLVDGIAYPTEGLKNWNRVVIMSDSGQLTLIERDGRLVKFDGKRGQDKTDGAQLIYKMDMLGDKRIMMSVVTLREDQAISRIYVGRIFCPEPGSGTPNNPPTSD